MTPTRSRLISFRNSPVGLVGATNLLVSDIGAWCSVIRPTHSCMCWPKVCLLHMLYCIHQCVEIRIRWWRKVAWSIPHFSFVSNYSELVSSLCTTPKLVNQISTSKTHLNVQQYFTTNRQTLWLSIFYI